MSKKIYTIEEIKESLKKIMTDKPVERVILFGSYAKNVATSESDMDFIVDTNGKLRGFAFLKLICQIKDSFQKEIDCFEQYEIIPGSKVDSEIRSTGIVVYEK